METIVAQESETEANRTADRNRLDQTADNRDRREGTTLESEIAEMERGAPHLAQLFRDMAEARNKWFPLG